MKKNKLIDFLLLLSLPLLTACNNKSKDVGDCYHKCVIQNIEKLERSTIEIDDKYIIHTDCGKSTIKNNKNFKVGDTIIIRKY
jgi:hypothetical protein